MEEYRTIKKTTVSTKSTLSRGKIKPKIGTKTVRSDWEFTVFNNLEAAVTPGTKIEYEVTKLPYIIEHEYNPDFTITLNDGRIIYVEAKGLGRRGGFDYPAQRKMVAIKKLHPDKDIRLVFMKDGIINKGSKMKASDWAIKNKFIFAIGEIPNDWFN